MVKHMADFRSNDPRFLSALDAQQPDWPITFADEQDLKNYSRQTQAGNAKKAYESLRYSVSQRLFMVVRSCVQAGLLNT
jgi:hypothetical protein